MSLHQVHSQTKTSTNIGFFISNERGLTLVEVLVSSMIIVLAAVGIYIGILYADSQLTRNYHDRVATLLASGECEWQYYRFMNRGEFDDFTSKPVVIESYDHLVSPGALAKPPLLGEMKMETRSDIDVIFGQTLRYTSLTVYVTWEEPLTGERVVAVREDFFR